MFVQRTQLLHGECPGIEGVIEEEIMERERKEDRTRKRAENNTAFLFLLVCYQTKVFKLSHAFFFLTQAREVCFWEVSLSWCCQSGTKQAL